MDARQGALLSGLDAAGRASAACLGVRRRSSASLDAGSGWTWSICLFTGIGGEAWAEAAKEIAAETGLDIAAHVIGPGRDYQDYAGDWAVAREIGEAGCLLVRPDHFIGYRHATAATDAKARLTQALETILGQKLSAEGADVGAGNSRASDW